MMTWSVANGCMYWNGLCVSRALFVKLGRHWPLSVAVLDFPDIPYYWFLCYTPVRTMSTDEKVLKILEDVQADIKGLKQGQKGLEAGQKGLEAGKQALQDDMTAVKADTAKIPGVEQRLDRMGKLLTGLTATTATVLEEQHAQRSDIRSLHTEVHASREEVKGEIEEVGYPF